VNDFSTVVRVMIADDNGEWVQRVVELASESSKLRLVGFAATGQDALRRAEQLAPDVALISRYLPDMTGLEVAERLAKEAPGVQAVIMDERPDAASVMEARARGVRDVLRKPFSQRELEECVVRVFEEARAAVEEALAKYPRYAKGRHPLAGTDAEPEPRQAMAVGRELIAVYHPKGGVGKTTVATNLAAAVLSNRVLKMRPALLDFDVDFGSVAEALGYGLEALEQGRTVAHWSYIADEPQRPEEIEDLLMEHPSGLWVLPAPRLPEEEALLTADLARKILSSVRRFYDPVIVDCTIDLRDSTIVALQEATRVIVVSTLDYQAMGRLAKVAEKMGQLGVSPTKIMVVLNRVREDSTFRLRDAVDLLSHYHFQFVEAIPWDPNVEDATNEGRVYFDIAPDSEFSEAIRRLAHAIWRIYPDDKAKKRGGGGILSSLWPRKK